MIGVGGAERGDFHEAVLFGQWLVGLGDNRDLGKIKLASQALDTKGWAGASAFDKLQPQALARAIRRPGPRFVTVATAASDCEGKMSELAEYERRITDALERIGRGADVLISHRHPVAEPVVALPEAEPEPEPESAEMAELRERLEAERAANAQLTERVRAIREKQETTLAALERRLVQATRALDVAQGEASRLKRANADLVEANRMLVETGGRAEAHLINRAMQAELEAMRAARAWEASELAEIIGGLEPLVAAHARAPEAGGDAGPHEEGGTHA